MVSSSEQNKAVETPLTQAKSLVENYRATFLDPERLETHLERLKSRLHMTNIRNKAVSLEDAEAIGVILLAEKPMREALELRKGMMELWDGLPKEEQTELAPLRNIVFHRAAKEVVPGP